MMPQAVRFTTHALLRSIGFKFELRRRGDSKIGLWRKAKMKKAARTQKHYPKRFILIPGFVDGPLPWAAVVVLLWPVLRKKYDEVIMVDYPGYTGALAHEKAFDSFDRMIAGLQDVLVSLRPHTVFGHSLGGWLAALFAGRGKWSSNYAGPEFLLLSNPAGYFPNLEMRGQWSQKFKRAVTQKDVSELRPHLFSKEPLWFKWFEKEFVKVLTSHEISEFIHSVKESHDLQEEFSQIKARVGLIWSEKDTLHPLECAYSWMAALKAQNVYSKGLVLKNLGHSPHVESPLQTAAGIAKIILNHDFYGLGGRWFQTLN